MCELNGGFDIRKSFFESVTFADHNAFWPSGFCKIPIGMLFNKNFSLLQHRIYLYA